MDMETLHLPLVRYIKNPDDAECAYELAEQYKRLGALSAATNYWMVAVENADNPVLRYDCLVEMAYSYWLQGDRLNEVLLMADYAKAEDPVDRRAYALKCMVYREQARAIDRNAQPGLWLEAWLKLLNEARTAANLPTEEGKKYDSRFTTDNVFLLHLCEALASIGLATEAEDTLNRLVNESAGDPQTRLKAMRLLYRNGLRIDILSEQTTTKTTDNGKH